MDEDVRRSPVRRSIQERIASRKQGDSDLVDSSFDLFADDGATTSSFRVDMTGSLVEEDPAPISMDDVYSEPAGLLDEPTARAYHFLAVPLDVTPADLEALAISTWNEAAWLGPGVLRLLEGVTLEGPWQLDSEIAKSLGVPRENPQVWLLRCPPRRGIAPLPEVAVFDEWARAFPDGMPVGVEQKVLHVLRRMARRLSGSIRIAGSGYIVHPDPDSAVGLRVFSDEWIPPEEMRSLLAPHVPNLFTPQPDPVAFGAPYALIAPVGSKSQVLFGVRQDTFRPRALRWDMWAKGTLFLYEIVWAPPEDLHDLEVRPTRAGRLERTKVSKLIETAAAVLATNMENSAIIDEDGFLLGLDEPPQE